MEENNDNVKTPDAVVDKSGKEFKAVKQLEKKQKGHLFKKHKRNIKRASPSCKKNIHSSQLLRKMTDFKISTSSVDFILW